jgi:hypothetical protein
MADSIADELKKLVELRDQGVLTPEEFESQKAGLLADSPPRVPPSFQSNPLADHAARTRSVSGSNILVLLVAVVLLGAIGALFKNSPGSSVVLLIVGGTSIWVYVDARNLGVRRGLRPGKFADAGPGTWFIGCLLLWIVFFPVYLGTRPTYVAMRRPTAEP